MRPDRRITLWRNRVVHVVPLAVVVSLNAFAAARLHVIGEPYGGEEHGLIRLIGRCVELLM